MQKGYRYELVAPVGRDFRSDFQPELTPEEMLSLGVFCGKYMTDCQEEFPAGWFKRAKLSPERRDCSLNYFGVNASQPLSVWRKKGWIHPTTRADGFSGTAGIMWVGVCQKRTAGRLDAGRLFAATSSKSDAIVSRAIRPAAHDNDKRCCTGPMTAEKSKGIFKLPVTHVCFGSLADIRAVAHSCPLLSHFPDNSGRTDFANRLQTSTSQQGCSHWAVHYGWWIDCYLGFAPKRFQQDWGGYAAQSLSSRW